MRDASQCVDLILRQFDPMGIQSREDLADALGMTEIEVQTHLLAMQQQGLVVSVEMSEACRGRSCDECGACGALNLKLAVWQITAAGRKMLNNLVM